MRLTYPLRDLVKIFFKLLRRDIGQMNILLASLMAGAALTAGLYSIKQQGNNSQLAILESKRQARNRIASAMRFYLALPDSCKETFNQATIDRIIDTHFVRVELYRKNQLLPENIMISDYILDRSSVPARLTVKFSSGTHKLMDEYIEFDLVPPSSGPITTCSMRTALASTVSTTLVGLNKDVLKTEKAIKFQKDLNTIPCVSATKGEVAYNITAGSTVTSIGWYVCTVVEGNLVWQQLAL
ncbi:MAG: hypothetical protein HQK53_08890 [Oligoflexia bacterium]|nr:hypothetical protein [Oligoflexia bacterium]